jgi:plastocyanin
MLRAALAAAVGLLLTAQTVPGPTPSPPPPAELVGRVELKNAKGELAPAPGSIVWLPGTPASGSARPTLTSRDKRFEPHVLAVTRGTTVSFPNVDRIYHNVFSLTPGHAFDLGLYRKGASRTFRFEKPGLVSVYCNIHPDMAAYLMVLEDAAFGMTGEDGRYRIGGLPAGRWTVRLWNERGGEREERVALAPGARQTLDLVLDASKYRRIQHKNKYGKDYPPVTRDDDRY